MADTVLFLGDNLTLVIAVTDSAGESADVSDAQSSEYGIFDLEGTQYVSKRLGFGVEIATNVVTVTLIPEDTLDLAPGLYTQELEIIDADGAVHTVYQGEILLKRGYIYSEEI